VSRSSQSQTHGLPDRYKYLRETSGVRSPLFSDIILFLDNFKYFSLSCDAKSLSSVREINRITNYSQQDATFLDFIATDALHVSGGSSTHHQEHITAHTVSGIVNQYCC